MSENAARAAAVEAAEQELNRAEPWLTPNDAATAAVVTALDHLASTDEGRAYLLRLVFSEEELNETVEALAAGLVHRVTHLPSLEDGDEECPVCRTAWVLRAALGERES